jgi:myosin heavy subunit
MTDNQFLTLQSGVGGTYETVNINGEEFPILPTSPDFAHAFRVLVGREEPPLNTDRDSYRRACQRVLEDAVDQVEIRRQGKAVFWPQDDHP